MVIFHTKYPKNFRASIRSAQFFKVRPPPPPPPNLKSWIRPWYDTLQLYITHCLSSGRAAEHGLFIYLYIFL